MVEQEILLTEAMQNNPSVVVDRDLLAATARDLRAIKDDVESIDQDLSNKITGVGVQKITVSGTAPVGPVLGDIWIEMTIPPALP